MPNVPIGPTTKAGYSVTLVGVIAAIVAYVTGDHSQQTLGVLTAAGLAALSLLVTQVGRYAQAREIAKVAVLVPVKGGLDDPAGPDELLEPGDEEHAITADIPTTPPGAVAPDHGDAGEAGAQP